MAKKITDTLMSKNRKVSDDQVHNFAKGYLEKIKVARKQMEVKDLIDKEKAQTQQQKGVEVSKSVVAKYLKE